MVRTIIIGAGAAGLAAAQRLIKSGHKQVVILEASDKIGGRVCSVNANYKSMNTTEAEQRHTLELGAQWVHGKVGNVAYELAFQEGLVDEVEGADEDMSEFDSMTFVVDDSGAAEDIDAEAMNELVAAISSRADSFKSTPSASMADYFNENFEDLIKVKDDKFKAMARMFKDFYHRLQRNIEGCDHWKYASFTGMVQRYQECPGPALIPYKSNYKYLDLMQLLARGIPQSLIRLNSEVTKVEHGKVLKVHISGSDEALEADYVIVTLSLGVLKAKAESLFEPKLPERKLEAIQKMSFGTVDKIFLEFDETWWGPDQTESGFAFVFSEAGQRMEDFGYDEADAERDWTRFLLGAYGVENRPRVLCFWLAGEGARKMETLSDDQVSADCMRTLRKFLAEKFSQIPDPVSVLISRWHSNPRTFGSYSYQSTVAEEAGLTQETLAEPVGGLLFAGEATHETYFSTVHGAIESGYREADRILKELD